MTVEIVPFKAEHFAALDIDPRQREEVTDAILKALEDTLALTVLVNGVPVAMAGVIEDTPWRGKAWSYMGADLKRHMVPVIRGLRRGLDLCSYSRIEMDVDMNFTEAHRMARLLGFTMEARERKNYGPNGQSCSLYSRTR